MKNPKQIYCVTLQNGNKSWFEEWEQAVAYEVESRKNKMNPQMSSYFAFDGEYYWKIVEPLINFGVKSNKEKFLEKYANLGNNETYLINAIRASVQRNTIYATDLPSDKREVIKEMWTYALESLASKYKNNQSKQQYLDDVLYLKNFMNKQFKDDKFFASTGFRISHAQKSLSVYLKYLWCTDKIEEPPCCPIDAIILQKVSINNVAWTAIDSINALENIIDIVAEVAAKERKTIAKWELANFN